MTESVQQSAVNHLKQLYMQLKDDKNVKQSDGFVIQEFWTRLGNAAEEVVQMTTMALAKPSQVNTKQMPDLIHGFQAAADNIVSVFLTLPKEQGMHMYKDTLKSVKNIVKSLCDLAMLLDIKGNRGVHERVQAAGIVFSFCNHIDNLPKNNLEAAIATLHKEELLLLDALQEIDEEVKNDMVIQKSSEEIDNNDLWNNQDRELLPPCVGLVKTARTCLKKIMAAVKAGGECRAHSQIAELDKLTTLAEQLSPVVDNFVSAIYPPMNRKVVKKSALEIVNVIQKLLGQAKVSHFIRDHDEAWLSFLLKAVDHNNNKLQPLLSPECPDSNTSEDSDADEGELDPGEDEDDEDDEEDDEDDEDDENEDNDDEEEETL